MEKQATAPISLEGEEERLRAKERQQAAEEEEKRDQERHSLLLRTVSAMALWYFFSLTTLFLNKELLSIWNVNPNLLGICQLSSSLFYGSLNNFCCCFSSSSPPKRPQVVPDGPSPGDGKELEAPKDLANPNPRSRMVWQLAFLGLVKFIALVGGLISLKYVAASFTETVKSTAPFFTVLFSRVFEGKITSLQVNLSLIPIVSGLLLCTLNEFSFNYIGFSAAVICNIMDCIQNVYSKKIFTDGTLSQVQLQFYSTLAAMLLQAPLLILQSAMDPLTMEAMKDSAVWTALLLDGMSFHLQSITAYYVVSLVHSVTFSVSNTVKRALLIWLSVIFFGNRLAPLAGLGTILVIFGVFLYNWAQRRFPPA